jgi:hypothetical protein
MEMTSDKKIQYKQTLLPFQAPVYKEIQKNEEKKMTQLSIDNFFRSKQNNTTISTKE